MSGNSMGILGNLGLGGLMASPTPSSGYGQSQYGHYNAQSGQAGYTAQQLHQYQQVMSNVAHAHNIANLGRPLYNPKWMIDGRIMTIDQFANELFGEDTPEKTMFLLKYSKGEK